MEKRYQVFVSSTYADLKNERQAVIQTLMEMDCIPAGMELFPAADEEQWQFIRRIIDDCDYYLLIIGGRYGSLTPEGISYTEKEYDYAVERGLRVVALVHGDPSTIPSGKSDLDTNLRKKLESFRKKVTTGRLVKFWTSASELPGLVALSLSKTIKTHPAIGWVRGDNASSVDLLQEINQLRKRNDELQAEILRLRTPADLQLPGGVTFDSLYEQLSKDKVHVPASVAGSKADLSMDLLTLTIMYAGVLARGVDNSTSSTPTEIFVMGEVASRLLSFGLAEHAKVPNSAHWLRIRLSRTGIGFLNRARPLWMSNMVELAKKSPDEFVKTLLDTADQYESSPDEPKATRRSRTKK